MVTKDQQQKLLGLLGGKSIPSSDDFKQLVLALDNHRVLAKVFLLEGTPFVFEQNPMKYVIFKEQVADKFDVGSQDVCIVGSARLGFSPSPYKYGAMFAETSDVDVVIVSEDLFNEGSHALFASLKNMGPQLHEIRPFLEHDKAPKNPPVVGLSDWRRMKEAVRNFAFHNFNPGLLPPDSALRHEVFEKIGSTSGIFLALDPKVFVSKVRCRIFQTWKAAEDYYTNSLREARRFFQGAPDVAAEGEDDEDVGVTLPEPKKNDG